MTIPPDPTPNVPGVPSVSTRIIWAQWIDVYGDPITSPPTVTHLGTPYYAVTQKATLFAKDRPAILTTGDVGEGTQGKWWAEVIVYNDPDLVGDVSIRINH